MCTIISFKLLNPRIGARVHPDIINKARKVQSHLLLKQIKTIHAKRVMNPDKIDKKQFKNIPIFQNLFP
ncbi:unnamed protein product [Blepharisma stoltei]|uniref:Uncharacterized protein n=1 Tax=Blepharisma stoltei TaxID=1481888 RepID=A0AAU9IWW5_9CILI|nr:unnamed protein product [Blepharisma stoltei]